MTLVKTLGLCEQVNKLAIRRDQQKAVPHLGKDLAQLNACQVPLLVVGCGKVGEEHTDGTHAIVKVVQQAVNLQQHAREDSGLGACNTT